MAIDKEKVSSWIKKTASKTSDTAVFIAGKAGNIATSVSDKVAEAGGITEIVSQKASEIGDVASSIADRTLSVADIAKEKALSAIDQNGDGEVGIEDVIILGLKLPGVHINRDTFLRKELATKCLAEDIDSAIATSPMDAGVSLETIDAIADSVINSERLKVSGISAALGAPGGMAMAATIPADITQYYGYLLRATQKLLYLYGFPEINLDDEDEDGSLDSATMNTIILCMGIMYGTAGANNAIKAMAKALGTGVEKKLLNTALTKGTFYPLVKSIAKWFGVKMTKSFFAGFFKSTIPLIGGVIGGGLTYASFKPCCDKLKDSLRDTMLSNPNHISSEAENLILNRIVEGTIVDIDTEESPEDNSETQG